jgi:FADH2 O2-dependent halogenase
MEAQTMQGPGNEQAAERYDIAIVGNHLATGLLAAILASHGVRTVVVPADADKHTPAGETTVPYTAELFYLLGNRFGVPEIGAMGMFSDLPDRLRMTSGVKRSLGFLYHRPGEAQRPAEALQFNVPAEHAEWHLYRPEVDDYAAALAVASGATVLRTQARPGGVRTGGAGVSVELADGRLVHAEYLVDGSADWRLLPQGAHKPTGDRLRHRSRLLFAHFTGVRPFESLVPAGRYGKASPWSAGTLLHVFDGGWVQVVPFGNHAESTNDLCSVAVSLEPARAGRADGSAQFRELTECFPDLRRQFAGATAAGSWREFDDWTVVADECVGPRWLLFDRAAGRHDLLLSRDVTMSLELVHAVAAGLLSLARSRDWAADGMKETGAFQLRLFELHDRFVAAGRIASGDFALWNAYLRVWLLWSILSALSLKRARLDCEAGSGARRWASVERFDQAAHWFFVPAGLPELLLEALHDIESVPSGTPAVAVADRIFARLRSERFVPPLYRFGDPAARYYYFTRARRLRMLLWAKTTAPSDFRRLLTADNVTAVAGTHRDGGIPGWPAPG